MYKRSSGWNIPSIQVLKIHNVIYLNRNCITILDETSTNHKKGKCMNLVWMYLAIIFQCRWVTLRDKRIAVQFSPLCFCNHGKFAIRAQGKMARWSTRGYFIHVTLRCMALIWWTNWIRSKACSTFTPTAIWRKVLSKMSASFRTLGKVVRSSANGDQIGPTLYVSPRIKGPHAYEVCPHTRSLVLHFELPCMYKYIIKKWVQYQVTNNPRSIGICEKIDSQSEIDDETW